MIFLWLKTVSLGNFIFFNAPQVVKQRMQTGQFTSASNAVRFIASREGFKGFYAVWSSPSLSFNILWQILFPAPVIFCLNVSLILIFQITGVWIFFTAGFALRCYSVLPLWADSIRLHACGKFLKFYFYVF